MILRAKTKKRLVILLAVAVAGAGTMGGVVLVHKQRQRAEAAKYRDQGLAAFKQGDYNQTLLKFAMAFQKRGIYQQDPEIVSALATARLKIEEPNGQHIYAAIQVLRGLSSLRNNQDEAVHWKLMELYPQVRFFTEALGEASWLESRYPAPKTPGSPGYEEALLQRARILRTKALANRGVRQNGEAEAAAREWTRLTPWDLDGQIFLLDLLRERNVPGQEIMDHVVALRRAHVGDPRFELLTAEACRQTELKSIEEASDGGQGSRGSRDAYFWAQRALSKVVPQVPDTTGLFDGSAREGGGRVPDFDYLMKLALEMDVLGHPQDADAAMAKGLADSVRTAEFDHHWAMRLYARNRFADLDKFVRDIVPAERGQDAELLAMRVLALHRLGQKEQAKPIIEAMRSRAANDRLAGTWGDLLQMVVLSDPPDVKKAIEVTSLTRSYMPRNAFVNFLLGTYYWQFNDQQMAQGFLDVAQQVAPYWPAPLVEVSQISAQQGDLRTALDVARRARTIAGTDREVLVNLAIQWARVLERDANENRAGLLSLLGEIEKAYPEEESVLPIRAFLLLNGQPPATQQAKALIEQALASGRPFREEILLQLARLSHKIDAGLENRCYETSIKLHSLTPQLAYQRATAMREKDPAQARQYLADARAKTDGRQLEWELCWARYLEDEYRERLAALETAESGAVTARANAPVSPVRKAAEDARQAAAAQWKAVAEQHPETTSVQLAVLSAPSVQPDHAFVGATLDRIEGQKSGGSTNVFVRYRRAIWTLEKNNRQPSKQDVDAAIASLEEITRREPGFLKAQVALAALLADRGSPQAAEHFVQASDLDPSSAKLALQAASMLMSRGEVTRVRQYLGRALLVKDIKPEEKQDAAELAAYLGDFKLAIQLIGEQGDRPSLLLARLYRQQNQLDKAETIARAFIAQATEKDKPFVPMAVLLLADIKAAHGQTTEAQQELARLDTLALEPGAGDLLRANYLSQYGTPEQTISAYLSATQKSPASVVAWRQLLAIYFEQGKTTEALETAKRCATALAEVSGGIQGEFGPIPQQILQNRDMVENLCVEEGGRKLLHAYVLAPAAEQEALWQCMQILSKAKAEKEPLDKTLPKIEQLANRFERAESMQLLMVEFDLATGRYDDAYAIATRAMETFPASADAARLATTALLAANRYEDAIGVARKWRERMMTDPLPADMAIIGANIQRGRPLEAIAMLKARNGNDPSYLDRAKVNPDRYARVIALAARAQLDSGNPADAAALVGPLLPRSAEWRTFWITSALAAIRSPDTIIAWLQQVTPAIPQDATAEWTNLAIAWYEVGQRTGRQELAHKAREMIEGVANKPAAGAPEFLKLGVMRESDGDKAGAEKAYRIALEKSPRMVEALNNLAVLLAHNDGNLDEALKLANQSVELSNKRVPNFLDTQADILAIMAKKAVSPQERQNLFTQAIKAEKAARDLDPGHILWYVNLAQIQLDAGDKSGARESFNQAEAYKPPERSMPLQLRQHMQELRSQLVEKTAG